MSRESQFGFEVMNIACGERLSVNNLFENLKMSLSKYIPEVSKIEAIHSNEREGDILHSHADISKAIQLIDYEVLVGVEAGLQSTVDWFMRN